MFVLSVGLLSIFQTSKTFLKICEVLHLLLIRASIIACSSSPGVHSTPYWNTWERAISSLNRQRGCKRKFKVSSRQRWQCPVYNSILQSFVWWSMNYMKSMFEILRTEYFTVFESLQKWLAHFYCRKTLRSYQN